MKNKEKFKEKLNDYLLSGVKWCVNKDNEIVTCNGENCESCSFYDMEDTCGENRLKWLNEECGDIKDNICEWINYDYRTICPKNHDIDNPYWRIPKDMDKLKYCPYCSKEIKIIN